MTRPSSAHTLAQVTSQSWPVRMARGVVNSPGRQVCLLNAITRRSHQREQYMRRKSNFIQPYQHDINGFRWPNIYFRSFCTFWILTHSPFLALVTLCLSPSLWFHPDCFHWIQMVLCNGALGGKERQWSTGQLIVRLFWFQLSGWVTKQKNRLPFLPQRPPAVQSLVVLSNAI